MSQISENIRSSNTWTEIHAQPGIWRAWADAFDYEEVREWVDAQGIETVWFCGAGTSAFIGDIIASGLPFDGPIDFRSVPSTDIVARPNYYLSKAPKNLLVVNFGRSGNSSESVGTLQAVEALAPDVKMLNITCNSNGMLAKATTGRSIVLPDACHDAGFAMTSSFSTMLLTALSIFDRDANVKENLVKLSDLLDANLATFADQIVASNRPERAVFVGSGPLAFAARESALKVMELSAGKIPALWDSTLGFRHGPKSFVAQDTAIYVLHSSVQDIARYDHDLISELKDQFPGASTFSIGPNGDYDTGSIGSPAWDAVLSVLPAQLASVIWSSELGLNIDDPFVGQSTLSRVVSGVRLYPVVAA